MQIDKDSAPGNAQGDDDSRLEIEAADAPATPAAPLDPDLAELQAAEAAVQAEDRDQQPATANEGAGRSAAPPAQQQPQPPSGDRAQQPPQMVPAAELAAMRRALREQRDRTAYLEGVLSATQGQPAQPAAGNANQPAATPAAQSPADQIAALRADLLQAAEDFDTGRLTAKELEQKRAEAEDRIAELRMAEMRRSMPQAPANDSLADRAIEEAHLAGLYGAHPYAANLSTEQATALAQMAATNLAMQGQPIGNSRQDTLRLRAEVARLSDTFGPQWGVKPSKNVDQQQQTGPQTPPMTPAAKARAAKMGLASGLPPDLGNFGQGAGAGITDGQIANMSDEEIGALPEAVKRRFYAA